MMRGAGRKGLEFHVFHAARGKGLEFHVFHAARANFTSTELCLESLERLLNADTESLGHGQQGEVWR